MSLTQIDGPTPESLNQELEDVQSILVSSPTESDTETICDCLLSDVTTPDGHLLGVTIDEGPDQRLDAWRRALGTLPDHTGIISVGEMTRSAAVTASTPGPRLGPVSVESISNPDDLTGIAMAVSDYLDEWANTDATPVVCFHSITSLLFHADTSRVFQFMHSITTRMKAAGAVVHYHFNPEAFDEATVNSIYGLVDAVVEVQDDGSVAIKRRHPA